MKYDHVCMKCMADKCSQAICLACGTAEVPERASPHHLPPGTRLQQKYLLGPVLGQVGFGITYLAYDLTLDLKLAIKEFFPHGLVARVPGKITFETYTGEHKKLYHYGLERFLGEAKTLARFSENPNIVTARDCLEQSCLDFSISTGSAMLLMCTILFARYGLGSKGMVEV